MTVYDVYVGRLRMIVREAPEGIQAEAADGEPRVIEDRGYDGLRVIAHDQTEAGLIAEEYYRESGFIF